MEFSLKMFQNLSFAQSEDSKHERIILVLCERGLTLLGEVVALSDLIHQCAREEFCAFPQEHNQESRTACHSVWKLWVFNEIQHNKLSNPVIHILTCLTSNKIYLTPA